MMDCADDIAERCSRPPDTITRTDGTVITECRDPDCDGWADCFVHWHIVED